MSWFQLNLKPLIPFFFIFLLFLLHHHQHFIYLFNNLTNLSLICNFAKAGYNNRAHVFRVPEGGREVLPALAIVPCQGREGLGRPPQHGWRPLHDVQGVLMP